MNGMESEGLFATGVHALLPGDAFDIPVHAAISLFEPSDLENPGQVESKTTSQFSGIIDTGASTTCLSRRLVRQLDLKTIGRCHVDTANGEAEHCMHIVNLIFAKHMIFSGLDVTSGDIGEPDFLLGMDILRQGHLTLFPVQGRLFMDFKLFVPI